MTNHCHELKLVGISCQATIYHAWHVLSPSLHTIYSPSILDCLPLYTLFSLLSPSNRNTLSTVSLHTDYSLNCLSPYTRYSLYCLPPYTLLFLLSRDQHTALSTVSLLTHYTLYRFPPYTLLSLLSPSLHTTLSTVWLPTHFSLLCLLLFFTSSFSTVYLNSYTLPTIVSSVSLTFSLQALYRLPHSLTNYYLLSPNSPTHSLTHLFC